MSTHDLIDTEAYNIVSEWGADFPLLETFFTSLEAKHIAGSLKC